MVESRRNGNGSPNFPCSQCGGLTRVVDSRPTQLLGEPCIRRRRRCQVCGHTKRTNEITDAATDRYERAAKLMRQMKALIEDNAL